jgi:hypothetical protein
MAKPHISWLKRPISWLKPNLIFMVGTPPFPVLNLLQVATRLQDFESQITAQLSNLQTDFARDSGRFSAAQEGFGQFQHVSDVHNM